MKEICKSLIVVLRIIMKNFVVQIVRMPNGLNKRLLIIVFTGKMVLNYTLTSIILNSI